MSGKKKVKLSRRMKRTIKLAVATLCLISAGVIALVPGTWTKADSVKPTVEVTAADNNIPVIPTTETIYTTGDGTFQFAYVGNSSGANKVAVLVGYDYERTLSGGALTIPDKVDAYSKYTNALGTSGGYVAVGKSGNFLFYPIYEEKTRQQEDPVTHQPVVDKDGNPVMEKYRAIKEFSPCYFSKYDEWYYNVNDEGYDDYDINNNRVVRPADNFYRYIASSDTYEKTIDESFQRITDATVAYISSQHAEKHINPTTNEVDGWEIKDLDPANPIGIFSKATNVVSLTVGPELLGIGDYAFYECTSLKSITLDNGTNCIGNHAFDKCINMQTVTIPSNSAVKALGAYAFANCNALEEFKVPVAVTKIGDCCFLNCFSMTNLDLDGEDASTNVALSTIGNDVFKGDSSLTQLEFPKTFYDPVDISWFEGCSGLEHITLPHANASVTETSTAGFKFADFMNMVTDEFYFEGDKDSNTPLHTMTKAQSFAFKFFGEEIYEKVVTDTAGRQLVFRVDDGNNLVYFYMDNGIENVDIPAKIGPYGVSSISDTSFKDNTTIKKITIPSTITRIEDNAFKGCCNLNDVIFAEPINIEYIGTGAFDTQVTTGPNSITNPELTFTGVASYDSLPFAYAMSKTSNINRGSQPTTYIKFYTGWPTNQTICYNPTKDKSELVSVPRLADLSSYTTTSYPYITTDMANAAATAASKYDSVTHTISDTATDDEKAIINSAINIEIPEGVQAIKDGLFSGINPDGTQIAGAAPNGDLLTITTDNLDSIDAYAFYGMPELVGAYINGDTSEIGDHAFGYSLKLADVDINSKLTDLGHGVFHYDEDLYTGNAKDDYDNLKGVLTDVDFGDEADYVCEEGIIFGLDGLGSKDTLKEVLMKRGDGFSSGAISDTELAGITSVDSEAFKSCDKVLSVDFSAATLNEIPEKCFEYTGDLYQVNLNKGTRRVGSKAFKDSNIRIVDIPSTVSVIDNDAFTGDSQTITFYTDPDSSAAYFADSQPNIVVKAKPVTCKVSFFDEDGVTLLDEKYVNYGEKAVCDVTPTKEGYTFTGWFPSVNSVIMDIATYAKYEITPDVKYTVKFIDYDDTIVSQQEVIAGQDAIEPKSPSREGYDFVGWRPSFIAVTKDLECYAQYEKQGATPANSPAPASPAPSGSGNNNNSSASPAPTKTFNLLVSGGSGSGSYVPGTSVVVQAQAPSGYVFEKWTCEDETVQFLSSTIPTTIVTMPSKDMIITASFKASSSSGNGNGSSGNGGNSGSKTTTPSTKVNISKTGFSNTDIASAKVSGSSDNFVLKITDDPNAKAAVEDALLNKYDSLEHIKYLAMDISLYDETGKNLITNTKDIKISATIPLPDDLLPYAGNNMVGVVENGKMVDVAAKYTTINGVPCVTFNPPHFSPYAIYVDTTNLSASSYYDETPKTGDGIAPKWFLCFGLIGVSVFFYVLSIDKKKVTLKK